ncbi:MAG: hypothetical protein IJK87_06010 [Prevotella sp.]|nr:hypothetical protein [Prevotella sp.]
MKKLFILMAFLALAAQVMTAQNVFELTDISQPNDIYSGEENEGAVLIRCNHSIPLSFSSSMDKSATPFMTDIQGTDSLYYIVFPTGKRYRGRQLTISARGYRSVTIDINLEPKQLLSYQIIDPNSMVDAGCYRGHRNKGISEMKNCNYAEAKNQFELASECSDVNKEENERNIALVDTILRYRALANNAYELLDYRKASAYYGKVIELNSFDWFSSDRKTECITKFTDDCNVLYEQAEHYLGEKDYDKAKELYQRVINKECNNYTSAVARLTEIEKYQTARKNHNTVIAYNFDLSGDCPVGLHIGGYRQKKTGGFFQFSFSTKNIGDCIRGDAEYGDYQEVNVAFGFTHKIASPVWFYITPFGGTVKTYYGNFAKDTYPGKDYPNDKEKAALENDKDDDTLTKINFACAWSPTVGLMVKYSYFAFQLGYQYRFPIKKGYEDFMGTSRFTIGVGVAF